MSPRSLALCFALLPLPSLLGCGGGAYQGPTGSSGASSSGAATTGSEVYPPPTSGTVSGSVYASGTASGSVYASGSSTAGDYANSGDASGSYSASGDGVPYDVADVWAPPTNVPPGCNFPLPSDCQVCSDGTTVCAHYAIQNGQCVTEYCPDPASVGCQAGVSCLAGESCTYTEGTNGSCTESCSCALGAGDGGSNVLECTRTCESVDSSFPGVTLGPTVPARPVQESASCQFPSPYVPPGTVSGCSPVGRWVTSQGGAMIQFDSVGDYYGGPAGTDLSQTYTSDGLYLAGEVDGGPGYLNLESSCGGGTYCTGPIEFQLSFEGNCSVMLLNQIYNPCGTYPDAPSGMVILKRF